MGIMVEEMENWALIWDQHSEGTEFDDEPTSFAGTVLKDTPDLMCTLLRTVQALTPQIETTEGCILWNTILSIYMHPRKYTIPQPKQERVHPRGNI